MGRRGYVVDLFPGLREVLLALRGTDGVRIAFASRTTAPDE